MTSEHIVCMGSYGDLCLVLPFAAEAFRATGNPTRLVVAQNYADILDGVSYVKPIVYPETWRRGQDDATVRRAVRWTQEKCGPTAIRWINPVESIGSRKPSGESFVHEIWKHLGRPNDWKRLPLTFDRRDEAREQALAVNVLMDKPKLDRPIVLVALNGVASPFPDREDLIESLREIPGVGVLDLSGIKAERPYDLLGLMDRSQLLVAADTLALHLSAASSVPVIALSRDLPTPWNGTPWHRRYVMHCRYSQYPHRKAELLHTVQQVLSGVRRLVPRPMTGLESHGYNPALIRWEGGLWTTYRHHPHGSWKTNLALALLDDKTFQAIRHLPLRMPAELETHSVEDMRLWMRDGCLMGSLVVAGVAGNRFRCTITYGEIRVTGERAELVGVVRPPYGHNDGSGLEKNWVFFERDGATHFIYACSPEQVVVRLNVTEPGEDWRTPALTWEWGQIRGGTPPLPFRGGWLRFFHSQVAISDKPRDVRYYTGAYVMDAEPPFAMRAISKYPVLSGHEWRSASAHWKPNVMIPYGAVESSDGWLVSVGVNDSAACVVKVNPEHLNL